MIDVKKEIIAKHEKGFDNEDSAVINDIVSLGKNMGLEVNNEDVEELLEDHKDELSTEELEQLQKQLQKVTVQEISSEEEEGCSYFFDPRNLCKMGRGAKFRGTISPR